jgi:hypothetical protein
MLLCQQHSVLPCGLVPALLQSGPWPSVLCFCCGGSGFFLATTGYQA